MKITIAFFMALTASTLLSQPHSHASKIKLVCEEKSLGKVLPGQDERSVMSSRDGRHVAYEVKVNGKSRIVVDGVAGKPYDDIAYFHFSFDGSRYGYAGILNRKWIIVADGKEIGQCDLTDWANPVFSPDGKRVGYSATHGHYESPDAQESVVVDGKEGPLHGQVDGIQFSPDSKHCAYRFNKTRKSEGDYGVVLDGVEQPQQRIDIRFSPNGAIAWVVRRGGKLAIEIDGKVVAEGFDSIDLSEPMFSPDGKRTAFWATRGKDSFVVVDGMQQKAYVRTRVPMGPRNMEPITFSPDGRKVAYPVHTCVVIDGQETKQYTGVVHDSVVFSPDGQKIAFTAITDSGMTVVVDAVSGKSFEQVGTPVFSPDSRRLAFATGSRNDADSWRVVVDGVQGPKYERIGGERWGPDDGVGIFSPDSKHFAYKAQQRGKFTIVVDGVEAGEYDGFVPESVIRFDSARTFHVPVLRNGEYLLVTGRIES